MTTRLKTGGRVAGTPNKTTAALKEAAQLHAEDALSNIAVTLPFCWTHRTRARCVQ
jgi:hypothetical protein